MQMSTAGTITEPKPRFESRIPSSSTITDGRTQTTDSSPIRRGRAIIARPLNSILPDDGSMIPSRTLKKVVLPAPLGPMRLTIEPSGIVKSISLTATSPPNRRVTFSATRMSRFSAAGCGASVATAEAVTGSPVTAHPPRWLR